MGITCENGYFYFVKRVPRRYADVDPRSHVRRALHTDSEREARTKAAAVEAEMLAYWEALSAGRSDESRAAFDAAKRLAAARGFAYRPAADLAAGASVDEILTRLEALMRTDGTPAPLVVAGAILGAVEAPKVTISEALAEMIGFAATDRLAGRSDAQVKRWRQPREDAVENFVALRGDKALVEVNRDDAKAFREWWAARIAKEKLSVNTANKQVGYLSDLFRTWTEYHALKLENPFLKLRFREAKGKTKGVPFSAEWITGRLLAKGALDGLNDEARDVLLVMVNTGARPSEILSAAPDAFAVADKVPFLDIRPDESRVLKTETAPRQIPLLGVSLAAAKRIAARGGISRYALKADSWSAAVNKFLTENGLRETPGHSAYSLRHSFEDRMTEAGIDDRIRAELMGHKYARPDYGRGGSMARRAEVLAAIAF